MPAASDGLTRPGRSNTKGLSPEVGCGPNMAAARGR